MIYMSNSTNRIAIDLEHAYHSVGDLVPVGAADAYRQAAARLGYDLTITTDEQTLDALGGDRSVERDLHAAVRLRGPDRAAWIDTHRDALVDPAVERDPREYLAANGVDPDEAHYVYTWLA